MKPPADRTAGHRQQGRSLGETKNRLNTPANPLVARATDTIVGVGYIPEERKRSGDSLHSENGEWDGIQCGIPTVDTIRFTIIKPMTPDHRMETIKAVIGAIMRKGL